MVRISPSLVFVDMVIDGLFAENDGRVTQYFQASGDERWLLAAFFMVRSLVDEPIRSGPGTARRCQRIGERGPPCRGLTYARQTRGRSQAALAALTAAFCKAVRFCSRAR